MSNMFYYKKTHQDQILPQKQKTKKIKFLHNKKHKDQIFTAIQTHTK